MAARAGFWVVLLAACFGVTAAGCSAIVENKLNDKGDNDCWGRDDGELCTSESPTEGTYLEVCIDHFCEELPQCGRMVDEVNAQCDCWSNCREYPGRRVCVPQEFPRPGVCRDDPESGPLGLCDPDGNCRSPG